MDEYFTLFDGAQAEIQLGSNLDGLGKLQSENLKT